MCGGVATAALACPYSIRDSSFISGDGPTTFRLCLLTNSDAADRDALVDAVEVATTTWLAASNVVVEIVDVDRDVKHELRGAIPGRLLNPAATPAAVLISPHNEAIELDVPDGPLADAVMDLAVQVIESPVRSQLAEHWITAWCALVVVTGDDDTQNQAALAAANEAATKIHGTVTEMDKLVEYAPEVIEIPHDSLDERLVLWSLGLAGSEDEDTTTPAKVAMLVGRGELRGPVLEGAKITTEKVYESLEMLGRSCSCTTDAAWLTGPVLPLEWTDQMQAAVVAELDFDPNDPTAAGAIRDVMSGLDQVLGYQEFTSGYREMTTPDADQPDAVALASTDENVTDKNVTNKNVTNKNVTNKNVTDKTAGDETPAEQHATGEGDNDTGEDNLAEATGALGDQRSKQTEYRPSTATSESLVSHDGANGDVDQAVIWSPNLVLMSLSVVVLVLGAGTVIAWGRRGH